MKNFIVSRCVDGRIVYCLRKAECENDVRMMFDDLVVVTELRL